MTGQVELCYVPASDSTALFVGDVVKLSSGNASQANGAPAVVRVASGTDVPYGVVIGITFEGVDDPTVTVPQVANLNTPVYRPASTARYVLVCTDPNAIYEVQLSSSGNSASTVAGYVGKNAGPALGSGGSTTTGASSMTLDTTSVATTATLPFKVVGFPHRPDNNAGDTYFSMWVKANNFSSANGTGSAGV
jgi:hypothetical protein